MSDWRTYLGGKEVKGYVIGEFKPNGTQIYGKRLIRVVDPANYNLEMEFQMALERE